MNRLLPLETDDGETILAALERLRIVSIEPRGDGSFVIREECDGYFKRLMTNEQLVRLSNELLAMAESSPCPPVTEAG